MIDRGTGGQGWTGRVLRYLEEKFRAVGLRNVALYLLVSFSETIPELKQQVQNARMSTKIN